MSTLTVRDLQPEVKAKLRQRAARKGRSMEAEVREILIAAVESEEPDEGLGQAILRIFADVDPADLPDFGDDRRLPRGLTL